MMRSIKLSYDAEDRLIEKDKQYDGSSLRKDDYSYNYVNSGNFKNLSGVLKHSGRFAMDMLPYYLFGNTVNDGSWIYERITGDSFGY